MNHNVVYLIANANLICDKDNYFPTPKVFSMNAVSVTKNHISVKNYCSNMSLHEQTILSN